MIAILIPHLLIVRAECVVGRAKVRPRGWHGVRSRGVDDVLSHDDGEAGVEVEIDVTVEEPRPGVVRLEPDRDVVPGGGCAGADDVPPNRVVVVVLGTAGRADDGEDML